MIVPRDNPSDRRTLRRLPGLALVGGCLLWLAWGGAGQGWGPPRRLQAAPTLPDYGALPSFSLHTHDGHAIGRDALLGTVWIADFIFTRCAGQCPLMSAQMAKLQAQLPRGPRIRLLSFTVDPLHDTPAVLAAYARHYGAEAGRWQFITGEAHTMATVARDGFRLGISDGGTPEEPITHSVRLVLVDQAGHIRGYYDATDAPAMERLVSDVLRLLRA